MALLKRIGEGEEALRNLGLKNVRIRVHGEIARLEVDSTSFPAILEQREEVLSILKKVGVPYLKKRKPADHCAVFQRSAGFLLFQSFAPIPDLLQNPVRLVAGGRRGLIIVDGVIR